MVHQGLQERIKNYIEANGISITEFGRRAGVTGQTALNYMKNQCVPSNTTLAKLEAALSTPNHSQEKKVIKMNEQKRQETTADMLEALKQSIECISTTVPLLDSEIKELETKLNSLYEVKKTLIAQKLGNSVTNEYWNMLSYKVQKMLLISKECKISDTEVYEGYVEERFSDMLRNDNYYWGTPDGDQIYCYVLTNNGKESYFIQVPMRSKEIRYFMAAVIHNDLYNVVFRKDHNMGEFNKEGI